MGIKSRYNFGVNACIKNCSNRDKKCDDCLHFSMYQPNLVTLSVAKCKSCGRKTRNLFLCNRCKNKLKRI
jgi:hypothetical protein